MATIKYKVKKEDDLSKLGVPASTVLKLNPGVKKLSTGQVINLPNLNSGGGGGSFIGGGGTIINAGGGKTVKIKPVRKIDKVPKAVTVTGAQGSALAALTPYAPAVPVSGGSFTGGNGTVVNNQPALQMLVNGRVAQPPTKGVTVSGTQGSLLAAQGVQTSSGQLYTPPAAGIPTGGGTGGGGGGGGGMTYEDVWNMKADQRRKAMKSTGAATPVAKKGGTGTNGYIPNLYGNNGGNGYIPGLYDNNGNGYIPGLYDNGGNGYIPGLYDNNGGSGYQNGGTGNGGYGANPNAAPVIPKGHAVNLSLNWRVG